MADIIDLAERRRRRHAVRSSTDRAARTVVCAYCDSVHPIIRTAEGEERCVTAFPDGTRWFCRNRGCRAAWTESRE